MNIKLYCSLISIIFSVTKYVEVAADFRAERDSHEASNLTHKQLLKVAAMTSSTQFLPILQPILIPRVVGSDGHEIVKQYLVDHMERLGWQVELDSFTDNTPIGQLQFTNIIATLDPSAPRFLVFACHYDSMAMHNRIFVGATDSAVPCAMLLHLASALAAPLSKSKNKFSLKLIFFDGEEALKTWGPTDSLYGSRHLASKLQNKPYPANNKDGSSELSRMDLLVLLDLLGAANPKIYDYYGFKTSKWYIQLASAETRLAQSNQLTKYSSNKKYFQQKFNYFGIEDDHIPFMQKGVPIVHFISFPFPTEWHTEGDNLELLDMDTINNLNKITQVFVAEYLRLDV